jgi:tetratricopeptide (TPR) repeat protein
VLGALGAVLVLGVIVTALFFILSGSSFEGMVGDVQALLGIKREPPIETLLADAQSALSEERYDDAIAIFKTVLEKDAESVEALKGTGQAYEAQDKWQHAAIWYEKWAQVEPDNPDALLALGWMEYRMGRCEEAIALFERVQGLAPDRPDVFLGLGRAHMEQGDYANSLEYAQRALELAPDGSVEQDQALQLMDDLARADPDGGALLALSQWYARQGDEATLQQVNQRILEGVPNSMDVSLGDQIRFIGYEIRELSEDQVLVDLYFQAMAPMDEDYTVWLHTYVHDEDVSLLPPDRRQHGFVGGGTTHPTSQWVEGAIYRDRTVRELAPGDYRFVFGAWLPDSGTRLVTSDDPERGAVDLGWRLVSEETLSAQVLSRHGWSQLEYGELEDARGSFEAVLAEDPNNLDALLGASAVYAAQGDRERTAQIAERLLPLIPEPQDVPLEDVMRFIGYGIQSSEDGQVEVDLYFEALASVDVDYVVWLHNRVRSAGIDLLPEDRREYGFVGGGFPMSYPTSRWVTGAIYRACTVRDLAPGEYQFIFGVWLQDSETRLKTPEDPEKGAIDLGWHVVGEE